MKLIVLRNNLKDGLDAIGRVVGDTGSTLPILKNFLMETVDGRIKFSATNLELAVTCFVSGKIVEAGSITIPLNIFASVVNNLQSERVSLETIGDHLVAKTDNYEAKIQGIKKEEFPIIPKPNNHQYFIEVAADSLRDALSSVMGAAQIAGLRPELNSVLFDYQISVLKLVATDTFRLAEKTLTESQFKANIDKTFKAIIPLKTINEVARIFKEDKEKVGFYFDPSQVLIKNENMEIISRLANGDFPDYQPIIPRETETEITLSRNELINALKLTGSFTDRLSEVRLVVRDGAKNIEIYSSNQALGENRYLIPAKIKGAPLEAVFNWRYLMDGLKGLSAEGISLGLNGSDRPATVRTPGDASYLYILMPIKAA